MPLPASAVTGALGPEQRIRESPPRGRPAPVCNRDRPPEEAPHPRSGQACATPQQFKDFFKFVFLVMIVEAHEPTDSYLATPTQQPRASRVLGKHEIGGFENLAALGERSPGLPRGVATTHKFGEIDMTMMFQFQSCARVEYADEIKTTGAIPFAALGEIGPSRAHEVSSFGRGQAFCRRDKPAARTGAHLEQKQAFPHPDRPRPAPAVRNANYGQGYAFQSVQATAPPRLPHPCPASAGHRHGSRLPQPSCDLLPQEVTAEIPDSARCCPLSPATRL